MTKLDNELPGSAWRPKGALRGLTGDVKTLVGNKGASMLIDVEYDTPRALLLSAQTNGSQGRINYTIRSGLDRAPLTEETIQTATTVHFSRTIVARSVQLVASYVLSASPTVFEVICSAVLVPVDVSASPADLSGVNASLTRGAPNIGSSVVLPQSITAGLLVDALVASPTVYGVGHRQGASIYNDSATDLYLNLGDLATTTSFTIKMAAGSYYEVPYGYAGVIGYIFGAAGAGNARVTLFSYAQFI